MELSIELSESQYKKLQETAMRLGVLPKQIVSAAVSDLLNVQDQDFRMAAEYVLRKNEELYRRLS